MMFDPRGTSLHLHLISLCITNVELTLTGSMGAGAGDTLMAAIRQLLVF